MEKEGFPTDLVVTVDDFLKSPWKDVISSEKERRYAYYWISLSRAAQAFKSGEEATRKVLWLLADACSMMLKPEKHNTPFEARAITGERRTAIVDDLSESDLTFFEDILPKITDFRLLARIADILWVLRKPKDPNHARAAICAYMEFPLDMDGFLRDGKKAWQRAISLTKILRKGTVSQAIQIQKKLLFAFDQADISNKYHALWLAGLLSEIGVEKKEYHFICNRLESYGDLLEDDNEFHCAREYFQFAAEWYKSDKNTNEINRLIVKIAENFVSEADHRVVDEKMGHIVVGSLIESAIKNYRLIPRTDRHQYQVDERISELHKRMNDENKLAHGQMFLVQTEKINIAESIKMIDDDYTDNPWPEILIKFANIALISDYEKEKQSALDSLRKYPIQNLFGSTHMRSDGRVISRTGGINFWDVDSPELKGLLNQRMIQNQGIHVNLLVSAQILPALEIIQLEHRITEPYLLSLCYYSSIVPPGREDLWAKGIYAGFENDFIVSTHLLAPQIEHLIRYQIKAHDLKTTTLDSLGIETENGLSTLLDSPNIAKVISPNLLFELKALLSDSIGPNQRNNVAHGLAETNTFYSVYAVYFWWLCLHLLINSVPWKRPTEPNENSPMDDAI